MSCLSKEIFFQCLFSLSQSQFLILLKKKCSKNSPLVDCFMWLTKLHWLLNCSSTQFYLEIYYFSLIVKLLLEGGWYHITWHINILPLTISHCSYFCFLYYTEISPRSSTLFLYSWHLVIQFLAHRVHLIKVCWMRTLMNIEMPTEWYFISLSPLPPTFLYHCSK